MYIPNVDENSQNEDQARLLEGEEKSYSVEGI